MKERRTPLLCTILFGCNLRNNRIVSVHLQSKPLKITVIHSNIVLTANVREDKIE